MPGHSTVGPYALVRGLRDSQVGSAFVAKRLGAEGFEKPVVLHCAPKQQLGEVVTEATRAARLSHAGIAHVLDVGIDEDLAYVALEHAEGTSLHALLLRGGLLSWDAATRIAVEITGALVYAHDRRDDQGRLLGLVHRRISPRRIVVGPGENARLTGFGVSWAWPHPSGFGSPEEERGEPIDGRADVFAIGRVLQRCVGPDRMPPTLSELVRWATHPLPEHRPTTSTLHAALRDTVRGASSDAPRA